MARKTVFFDTVFSFAYSDSGHLVFVWILRNQVAGNDEKIQMNTTEMMDESFERFIIATKAKGTGDKTLKTYRENIPAPP